MSIRRLLSALVAVLLPLALLPLLDSPAHAAHASTSHADSQFLEGSLLPLDLSAIVGIEGATADYQDGHTAGTEVTDVAALDVTALGAINLNLPALTVTLDDLLNLGVITQQATAQQLGVSSADTGTTSLSLDLMALLGTNPALTSADLNLGAVSSHADYDAQTDTLVRTTTVADATLTLDAPLVGGIVAGVNSALDPLATTANSLVATLDAALLGALTDVIALVPTATGTPLLTADVTVDLSRLDTAVAQILNQTLDTGLVNIDLSTGLITVDLAAGIDLNNIPPNSTLLSPTVLQSVSADVATLLGKVQSDLNTLLANALPYIDVTLAANATITDPILGTTVAGLDITYAGTLQSLVDGTAPLSIVGAGLLSVVPLGTAVPLVQGILATAATDTLGTVVADTGTAVNTLVTDATNSLSTVLTALEGVAAINLNVQNVGPDPTVEPAWVTAVQVQVLGTTVTELNLATSSVGPNTFAVLDVTAPVVAITSPTDGAVLTDTTPTITGTVSDDVTPAPDMTVDVVITDATGTVVFQGPATVNPDGTWTIDSTTLTDGDYTVVATATDTAGNTATDGPVAFTIDATAPAGDTTAPVVDITSPAEGDTVGDSTPTIEGTVDDPEAEVIVTITDGDGNIVAEGPAEVDAEGNWTFTPAAELPDGDYTVTANATDAAGNTGSDGPVAFTVDTAAAGGGADNGPTTTTAGTKLPATGASLSGLSLGLLALLSLALIGSGGLMLRRREA